MITVETKGICPSKIHFEIQEGKIHNVIFEGGCPGNLQAISRLVEDMPAKNVVALLKGITCGNKTTSCSAQLAVAVEKAVNEK